MAAVVLRIGMVAAFSEKGGEAPVPGGMLGQPVIDLDDAPRSSGGPPGMDVQRRAGRRFQLELIDGHSPHPAMIVGRPLEGVKGSPEL